MSYHNNSAFGARRGSWKIAPRRGEGINLFRARNRLNGYRFMVFVSVARAHSRPISSY